MTPERDFTTSDIISGSSAPVATVTSPTYHAPRPFPSPCAQLHQTWVRTGQQLAHRYDFVLGPTGPGCEGTPFNPLPPPPPYTHTHLERTHKTRSNGHQHRCSTHTDGHAQGASGTYAAAKRRWLSASRISPGTVSVHRHEFVRVDAYLGCSATRPLLMGPFGGGNPGRLLSGGGGGLCTKNGPIRFCLFFPTMVTLV